MEQDQETQGAAWGGGRVAADNGAEHRARVVLEWVHAVAVTGVWLVRLPHRPNR
ncbi:MAG: hypothetical protein NTV49_14405 [Kiritimatiellaeota bacterium]|nr:hypothetical protein [Kiritimatiellota bacterium]